MIEALIDGIAIRSERLRVLRSRTVHRLFVCLHIYYLVILIEIWLVIWVETVPLLDCNRTLIFNTLIVNNWRVIILDIVATLLHGVLRIHRPQYRLTVLMLSRYHMFTYLIIARIMLILQKVLGRAILIYHLKLLRKSWLHFGRNTLTLKHRLTFLLLKGVLYLTITLHQIRFTITLH